ALEQRRAFEEVSYAGDLFPRAVGEQLTQAMPQERCEGLGAEEGARRGKHGIFGVVRFGHRIALRLPPESTVKRGGFCRHQKVGLRPTPFLSIRPCLVARRGRPHTLVAQAASDRDRRRRSTKSLCLCCSGGCRRPGPEPPAPNSARDRRTL